MGFDVFGCRARSKAGEYFRNNVWWWRPLADYVLEHVDIPENDATEWHMNGGYTISATSATKIAMALQELLTSGDVAQFEKEYAAGQKALPDERCNLCGGTGRRDDAIVKGTCNACDGKGTVRPWATHYPFSEQNVREFVGFCRDSGGFRIY